VSIGKRNGQIHEWLEGDGDEVADGTDDGVLELTLKGASYDRVVASQVLLPKSAKEWPITNYMETTLSKRYIYMYGCVKF
jgi:hypothetical protein